MYASSTYYDAAYTHVSSDGTDHSYIDQDVTTSASPEFAAITVNGDITVTGTVDGVDISTASGTC